MVAVVADTGWATWPAPAKLNLFLRVLGQRADGYHELQTGFQLLAWGDSIHLRLRSDGMIRLVETDNNVFAGDDVLIGENWVNHGIQPRGGADYSVVEDEDLALRAAKLLQGESRCLLGCDIAVVKRIPLGGGFGGGSSDAATVLVALDALWNTGLGTERLAALGLRLGADVPVFVRGRNAWAEGIGERLTPLQLPPRWYLIVDPGVHVPTAQLFGAHDLTRDAAPATMTGLSSAMLLGNAFERVLRRREPEVAAALDALALFGHACVTGTGGGCYVAFPTMEQAEAAHAALPKRWNAWVATGASRSALLDRLEQNS